MLDVFKVYNTSYRHRKFTRTTLLRNYLLANLKLPQQGNKKDKEIQTFEPGTNQLLILNRSQTFQACFLTCQEAKLEP